MDNQNPSQHGGENCCSSKAGSQRTGYDRATPKTWSAGAVAIAAAIMASACCWLPLALLGLGVSAAGLSRYIVGARWIFVAVAVAALGLGFYLSYRRKAACAPGEVCAPSGLARFNRVMLWGSAVLVLVFAFFPYYFGFVTRAFSAAHPAVAGHTQHPLQPAVGLSRFSYRIQGMDCKACAVGLQAMLRRLSGVKTAVVSYRDGTAKVLAAPAFDPHRVIRALDSVGYKTTLNQPARAAAAR